jgi:hypothetical protein
MDRPLLSLVTYGRVGAAIGTQILKDNEVRRKQIGARFAPEAVTADTARGTRDGLSIALPNG